MIFQLRDYQVKAHEMIVDGFRKNLKLLLLMSTGSGKSKTAVSFIKKYQKHYIFIIVVRRRGLVLQLENDLKLFELDYGVFMAGHELYSSKKEIQICSIDTLTNRVLPHLFAEKDIVLIIDEADESNADGYQEIINAYTKRNQLLRPSHFNTAQMLKPLRPAFLLGLTATAFDDPLAHFDEVIKPITARELNREKNLVDYKYIIPSLIDFSKIGIVKGEFNNRDIQKIFNSPKEIENNIKAWVQFGEDRQTLVFCSNQDHARNVTNYINKIYNKRVAQEIDAESPDEFRDQVITEFRNCEIKFLINVRLITRGVDIPEIGCILDLAPTTRKNNHIQKLGRASRPNRLYKDAIIIDCANNCVNNGHFYKEREVNLKTGIKFNRAELGEQMRVCLNCFRGADPIDFGLKNICPFCAHFNGKIIKKKVSKTQVLQNASEEQIEQLEMINYFKKELWKLQNLGKKYSFDIAHQILIERMISKFGITKIRKIKFSIGFKE